MGKHRKRRQHRAGRRIALVSVALVVPVTSGAVVYAATGESHRTAAPSPVRSGRPSHRPRTAARRAVRPAAVPARTPSARASTTPPAPTPVVGPRIRFAPYADVLTWPPLDLTRSRVKDYTMGFVASGGGCSAAWGGLSPIDTAFALGRIKAVPGKVVVSFGGPHGTELAQTCDSVARLVRAYRAVLAVTHPSGIDFFLTDAALADTASVRRRTEALADVARHGGPPVSVTLPLRRTGLSAAALGALRTAAEGGLPVALVNLVPADGAGQSLTARTPSSSASTARATRRCGGGPASRRSSARSSARRTPGGSPPGRPRAAWAACRCGR